MSPRRVLIISVVLNVIALSALAFLLNRPAATTSNTASAAAPVRWITNTTFVTNLVTAAVSPPLPKDFFHWSNVESPDYRQYIQRLRDIGCPEQTIRDIIIADVSKLYAEKRAALSEPERVYRFWESSDQQYLRDNVKYQQTVRELEKEKEQLIRDLLGVSLRREIAKIYGGETPFNRSLAFLPSDRRQPVQDIFDRYDDLERAIMVAANGRPTEEQRQQIDELRAQREAEATSLMSPDEQQEYEMTTSRLARDIRNNLNGFDASRDEFLAIHDIKQAFNEQLGKREGKETDEQRVVRKELERQTEEAMQIALGAERYAEYQRSQDDAYEELYELTRRYDLNKETAASVYDMKRLAEEQARQIESNPSLSPEQKLAARKLIADQAKTAAGTVLGNDAFSYYLRRDGRWLDRISRPPAARVPLGNRN